ncbi:hypothetical protein MF406_00990 [Georgenia sp. TF02-10]|uniref:Clp protease N-terminal domain-containing protein n=1 Tax=Georgenia sp. TF02-10 TaxID=2917725 RepID=UPI001FA7E98B|nr:Clp protease N-terminal domain-containing protein [Georgenia sp. TF02-10]UNX54908.1 hypothetical protein MF406_00990 [Georgenia sp. TF02-10]
MDIEGEAARLADSIAAEHGDDPRGALAAAQRLEAELALTGEHVLRRVVAKVRDAGLSWSEVGDVLGVSKQAAQQRFAGPASGGRVVVGEGLFGRFDEHLRAALAQAVGHAADVGAEQLSAAHLLVGLAGVPAGSGAAILQSLDPDGAALAEVSAPRQRRWRRRRTPLPFSADARAAIEGLGRVADEQNLPAVGTEHLLLVLAADATTDVGRALQARGITAAVVAERLDGP